MNRIPASLGCLECERLRASYERTLAMRLQAEADLLTAIRSRDSTALQTARNTNYSVIEQWTRAEAALRGHEQTHLLTAAA